MNSNDGTSLLAFGKGELLICDSNNSINEIQSFIDNHKGQFIFSCLSYDLKNEIEKLDSQNFDGMKFPKALLWIPEFIVEIDNDAFQFTIGKSNEENERFVSQFITEKNRPEFKSFPHQLKPRTSQEDYLSHVNQLKEEIQQGNIYEVNYCQEFYAENVELENSLNAYFKLNSITKAPYSVYFNIGNFILMSGSPERFIQRKGNKLSSSPIKGTSKRGKDVAEDEHLKKLLYNDPKERSENVMIVDLVRNDLSKLALDNTVKVDELFGFVFLVDYFFDLTFWEKVLYFFSMPIFGLIAYRFFLYTSYISVKTDFVIEMKTQKDKIAQLRKRKTDLFELLFTSNTPS